MTCPIEHGCCDFCKFYSDNGGGPEKRAGFAGAGWCSILEMETLASGFCDGFVCGICETKNIERSVTLKGNNTATHIAERMPFTIKIF